MAGQKGKGDRSRPARDLGHGDIPADWKLLDEVPENPGDGTKANKEHIDWWEAQRGGKLGLMSELIEMRIGEVVSLKDRIEKTVSKAFKPPMTENPGCETKLIIIVSCSLDVLTL